MGDRATMGTDGATNSGCIVAILGQPLRIKCGADLYYGLGRLQLRQHDSFRSYTNTFTDASQESKRIIGPVANGTLIAKCVMQQFEDMVGPDKDNISNVGLTMQIRSTSGQTCTVDSGIVYATLSDFEPDDKHMVAVLDSAINIEGRCIQVNLDPTVISTAGTVTTNTYCSLDSDLDY